MGLADAAADLAAPALKSVWGESVAYTPVSTGQPVTVTALYDARPVLVSVGTGAEIQSTAPTLDVLIADLPAHPRVNDTCTVRELAYRVTAVAPGSDGWATLTIVRVT